ncbi:MAG: HNH endonuclease [Acidobacteriota bacterium]|nr:HNH endonuclease [Acidobacteriota bacterium]
MSLRMINSVLANRSIDTHCSLCGRTFKLVKATEEHIFPGWLQHSHDLWNQKLTIPNLVGRRYKSVKIPICVKCNNLRYGRLETRLAPLVTSADPFAAVEATTDDELAIWLGKISWLLWRKSHSAVDFRTRDQAEPERVLRDEMIPGTHFTGIMQRAFALRKNMHACYLDDPPDLSRYSEPYSLYRVRIHTREPQFSQFDFKDNVAITGTALRSRSLGLICLFDGGLHRRFRGKRFEGLLGETLHPVQFDEVVGRIFYDQTVLDERACRVQYDWNRPLNAVIAQNQSPRFYYPYLQQQHDIRRYAAIVGQYTSSDPSQIVPDPDKEQTVTYLWDADGHFYQYPISGDELDAELTNPKRVAVPRVSRNHFGEPVGSRGSAKTVSDCLMTSIDKKRPNRGGPPARKKMPTRTQ